jgi:hypothetical protein
MESEGKQMKENAKKKRKRKEGQTKTITKRDYP